MRVGKRLEKRNSLKGKVGEARSFYFKHRQDRAVKCNCTILIGLRVQDNVL